MDIRGWEERYRLEDFDLEPTALVVETAKAAADGLLSAYLVTMFSEPVFFNFNTSPLFGAAAGLLCAKMARALGAKVARTSMES